MLSVRTMMMTPMNQLPPIAIEHVKHLSSIYGFCSEICVSAYANYCQAVLDLPCKTPSYKMSDKDKQWFIEKDYIKK
jgi:hypothetical protein